MAATPFGEFSTDVGKVLAPTKKEVAQNPGKYEGTSFDPIAQVVPWMITRMYEIFENDFSGPYDFGTWFKANPAGAMLYFKQTHENNSLNFSGLTANQKMAMGLILK